MTLDGTRPTRLVLASASPRRQALLQEHGYAFDVIVSPHEEPEEMPGATTPAERAEALSAFKAESVRLLAEDALILAGDTVVALNETVFGKPCDCDDARRIISTLSGTRHEVITGVTLLDGPSGRRITRHDRTIVAMRALGGVGARRLPGNRRLGGQSRSLRHTRSRRRLC